MDRMGHDLDICVVPPVVEDLLAVAMIAIARVN